MAVAELTRVRRPPLVVIAVALVATLALAACSVRLVADYDEQIDTTATRLQKDMDRFLTSIEKDPEREVTSYEANRGFYVDYEVELRSVLVRARAHEENEITVRQLELMLGSLEELEAAHADAPIPPDAARTFRDLFNQAWTAVITWEVAKKRGEG